MRKQRDRRHNFRPPPQLPAGPLVGGLVETSGERRNSFLAPGEGRRAKWSESRVEGSLSSKTALGPSASWDLEAREAEAEAEEEALEMMMNSASATRTALEPLFAPLVPLRLLAAAS